MHAGGRILFNFQKYEQLLQLAKYFYGANDFITFNY